MDITQQLLAFLRRAHRSHSHRRAQRMALRELMSLHPERLDDLGIDAVALREALLQSRRSEERPLGSLVDERSIARREQPEQLAWAEPTLR